MNRLLPILIATLIGLIMSATLIVIKTIVIMFLWNNLIVDLFSAPVLSFWQTLGITLLLHLILPTSSIERNVKGND